MLTHSTGYCTTLPLITDISKLCYPKVSHADTDSQHIFKPHVEMFLKQLQRLPCTPITPRTTMMGTPVKNCNMIIVIVIVIVIGIVLAQVLAQLKICQLTTLIEGISAPAGPTFRDMQHC